MTDEERKAIELFKKIQKEAPYMIWVNLTPYNKSNLIQTILNLIEKQEKAIDRMAEVIEECRQNDCLYSDDIDLSQIAGIKAIKEYFIKGEK